MTVTVGTDSYITEAELTAYATERGITLTADESVLLIKAMDYLESLSYKGERTTASQALSWPRSGVYVDNYQLPSGTVPDIIKDAQAAVASAIDAGTDPLTDMPRGVKREKADVVEIEYMDNAAPIAISRRITASLRKVLAGGGGVNNIMVARG